MDRDVVLVVDDMEINRVILREILSVDYEILEAEDGLAAVEIMRNADPLPNLVLMDIMMPRMDGFEALEIIKSDPRMEKTPVLFITATNASSDESRALQAGAVDYIVKPFDPIVVKARVDNNIKLLHYSMHLEMLVEIKSKELYKTNETMLETLANIIEYRSLESGTHIRRTKELTQIMLDSMINNPLFSGELSPQICESIVKASAMHDIGKIGIPDNILLKPGRLTPEEFDVIKTHTVIGADIFKTISEELGNGNSYFRHCEEICRHHHERWDGKGYPEGLSGSEIPLSARILSVVDVYDALVSKRCYKDGMSHEQAVEILKEGAGTQFDSDVIDVFLELEQVFKSQ